MAKENLIIEKKNFEEQVKSQIRKGTDLLKREVSADKTTIVQPRRIIKIKNYCESEKKSFLSDCRKWDSYNSTLINQSLDNNNSPHSYFSAYGRTGDLTQLLGGTVYATS